MDYDDTPTFEPMHTGHRSATAQTRRKSLAEIERRVQHPVCRKKLQFTKKQVRQRIAEALKLGRVFRAYKCRNCRLFHLTSQEKRHVKTR